jgi:hypothetical protein
MHVSLDSMWRRESKKTYNLNMTVVFLIPKGMYGYPIQKSIYKYFILKSMYDTLFQKVYTGTPILHNTYIFPTD